MNASDFSGRIQPGRTSLGLRPPDDRIVVNVTTPEDQAMEKAVSAAEANRRFSELLRTVRTGRSVLVTSHGKPVARIVPVSEEDRARRSARSALLARLRRERLATVGRWTRDELYDEAP
jgi:prevent-host-death family protein